MKENDSEKILQEYSSFLDNITTVGNAKFTKFNKEKDRADIFLSDCLGEGQYMKLTETFKLLLVLSHGQAGVGRGFSMNKEIEVENLKERSLVAQLVICDHVNSVAGILNVSMSNSLITSAASARSRYDTYLEDEIQKNKSDPQLKKRKCVINEIKS